MNSLTHEQSIDREYMQVVQMTDHVFDWVENIVVAGWLAFSLISTMFSKRLILKSF